MRQFLVSIMLAMLATSTWATSTTCQGEIAAFNKSQKSFRVLLRGLSRYIIINDESTIELLKKAKKSSKNVTISFNQDLGECESFTKDMVHSGHIKVSRSSDFVIYISPDANVFNTHGTINKPLSSLRKAHSLLLKYKPNSKVKILIGPGTYYEQNVIWRFTNNHPIVFKPQFSEQEKPVFDGNGKLLNWFVLDKSEGKPSYLEFYSLKVQNYANGLSISGDRENIDAWNSHNIIDGMHFFQIGNKYKTDEDDAYKALGLSQSRYNKVVNSIFENIENVGDSDSEIKMHAIYLSHYASDNMIENNYFSSISGDPLKVRDFSNNNRFYRNYFENVNSDIGAAAFIDAYCEADNPECSKSTHECPSYGNQVRFNNYPQGAALFRYGGSDQLDNCPMPDGVRRLMTSDNSIHKE